MDWACKLDVFPGVYSPAEDSSLLLDAILGERGALLEVGCGSGFVSIGYAIMNKAKVDCCDIDLMAVKNSSWNSLKLGVEVRAFYSDVFSMVREKYSVIAFNPPYLDNLTGDVATEDNGSIGKFIMDVDKFLLEGGKAFLLLSTENKMYGEYLEGMASEGWEKVCEKRLFFERLEVWRLTKEV